MKWNKARVPNEKGRGMKGTKEQSTNSTTQD